MTLADLKKSIHEKIDNLEDPDYLAMLNRMIGYKDKITEEHLAGIKQGKQGIRNGNFLTMTTEELEKRYEKWLKE